MTDSNLRYRVSISPLVRSSRPDQPALLVLYLLNDLSSAHRPLLEPVQLASVVSHLCIIHFISTTPSLVKQSIWYTFQSLHNLIGYGTFEEHFGIDISSTLCLLRLDFCVR